jgi:endonuclease YncB( thermonuclease family)
MHLISKLFVLVIIISCCTANGVRSVGSSSQSQYENDPCGDPRKESMSWSPVKGVVTKVIDGDTVIMSLTNKKRLQVHLVGIDAPPLDEAFGSDAQKFLEHVVNGETVEVWVNPSNWHRKPRQPREITGVMYLRSADMKDINLSLLEAGLARHKSSEPYSISNYTDCRYVRAEEKARATKRGLWQRAT